MLDGSACRRPRPDAVFVETIDDLVDEVVDDLYLRKYAADRREPPLIDYADALRARPTTRSATGRPGSCPPTADAARAGRAPVRLRAGAVRAEVERRKRARRLLDYDDLLTRLRDALADPRHGDAARAAAPATATGWCWSTSSRTPTRCSGRSCGARSTGTHAGPDRRPEAGDLRVPRRRRRQLPAGRRARRRPTTLGTQLAQRRGRCWTALDALFGGAALGDPRIVVRPVDARPPGARGSPAARAVRPVRLRVAPRTGSACRDAAAVDAGPRPLVAGDVAADVVALLGARRGSTATAAAGAAAATSPCWSARTRRRRRPRRAGRGRRARRAAGAAQRVRLRRRARTG